MMAVDTLYTEAEVAEHLGYSRNWLRQQRLKGNGPQFIRLGNRVMYDMADVDTWVESLKRGTNDEQ